MPRRIAWIPGLMLFIAAVGSGCTNSSEPSEPSGRMDPQTALDSEISAIASGGRYVAPTAEELATFQQAMAAVCLDARKAEELLKPLGYSVTPVIDDASGGRELQLVQEDAESGAERRGWGLYVIDCNATGAPLVEVPHPVSDEGTERLGWDLFELADAGALLVAGSKRDADGVSSDVAHAASSVFSTVHEALLTRGGEVVQIHGFAAEEHEDLLQDAVVSSGSTDPQYADLAHRVDSALTAAGVSVCLFDANSDCSELGATTNVQGMSARGAGAWFVHVELDEDLRQARSDVVVEALTKALGMQATR